MQKHFWQYLSLRILVGWLLVSILPALLLFWEFIAEDDIQITQVNSVVASSFALILALIALERFTQFPGQKSMATVLPTILASSLFVGAVIFIFRLPYSVYYLLLSALCAVIFCFISQIALRAVTQIVIGYIPTGRCHDLLAIEGVHWVAIDDRCHGLPKQPIIHALVADLADHRLSVDCERLLAQTALQGIPVYNVLQVCESLTGRLPIKHLYENNLGSLLPSSSYLLIKRGLDTLAVLISLPIVLPLALFVAVGIKLSQQQKNEPVVFTQQRVGQGGHLFTMYKFRSMVSSAEKDGYQMATHNDLRVTKFGKFIRKTRLDELPQFINVLKGDMSLIGPRPEQLSFVNQFNETIPFYSYRHIVKPGISGWAQVMHGYASDEDETKVKLEHDFFYIKNFSLTLDLLIVIKTIQTMLTGFGAR